MASGWKFKWHQEQKITVIQVDYIELCISERNLQYECICNILLKNLLTVCKTCKEVTYITDVSCIVSSLDKLWDIWGKSIFMFNFLSRRSV